MLSISEIKVGKIIQITGEPYLVTKTDHHKMGRGGAVLKTKLRNLITGNVLDKTFQGNDKAEEANTEKKKANYLYKDEQEAHFMDNENYEQFSLPVEAIGEKIKFLKDGTDVDVLYFDNKPMAVELPIKVVLKVTSAPPGVKGNTAGNVTKQIELETGAVISAPMFINEGDLIRINTDTGEYVERA
ncbi:MAG: elongation factor P [Planctomycetes bacterium]|jgi:elongation factor P|nr:elongation factor P [Planctomycetota bacterium]